MSPIEHLERLIHLGHYAQARIYAGQLIAQSEDIRAKQLYALSLSKSGVPEAAREYLEGIATTTPDDSETMGILGSIYKELFKKEKATQYALLARDTYEKNFQLTQNYYNGINAATMSVMAGKSNRGKEIAGEVLAILKRPETDPWEAATEGEACLLLKERSRAEAAYQRAHQLMGSDWGKMNSVYGQLWLLNHYLPVPASIMKMFAPPVVAAFVGHMIDRADRRSPRFPADIEPRIKEAILNTIKIEGVKIGYCSLACGGDILFAEAIEEVDGELNLFLPFKADDFIEASVRFAGEGWVSRFNRLLSRHPVTQLTGDSYENHPDLFSLQSNIVFGLSVLRAASHHEEPKLISVLSGSDVMQKTGGTRDTIALWPFPKRHLNIDPDHFSGNISTRGTDEPGIAPPSTRPVLYLGWCDLPNAEFATSVLAELETAFVVPDAVDVREDRLIVAYKNLFNVLQFCEMIEGLVSKRDVKKPVIRISLHVGPLVTNSGQVRQRLSGTFIEAMQAIHAITVPGSIFATANVAAILALHLGKYRLRFVDTLTVDGSGNVELYHVEILKASLDRGR